MRFSRRKLIFDGPLLLGLGVPALAREAAPLLSHHTESAKDGHDEHAAHREMMAQPRFTRAERQYSVPDVQLVNETGSRIALTEALSKSRPIALNFIYTSCTTICPVMTASFLHMQHLLAGSGLMPAFVSVSVDPDFDSPAILKSYAAKVGAQWTFLTGPRPVILDVLRSFDVWRGNKANHAAVTLLRNAGAARWTRIEGLASADQLAGIWKELSA